MKPSIEEIFTYHITNSQKVEVQCEVQHGHVGNLFSSYLLFSYEFAMIISLYFHVVHFIKTSSDTAETCVSSVLGVEY